MRIDVDGRSFDVAFNHVQHAPKQLSPNVAVKGRTECTVSQLYLDYNNRLIREKDNTIRSTPLGHGVGYCSVQDVFSKEIGRKIALKNALAALSRDTRKAIWRSYFQRTNAKYDGVSRVKNRKEVLASA